MNKLFRAVFPFATPIGRFYNREEGQFPERDLDGVSREPSLKRRRESTAITTALVSLLNRGPEFAGSTLLFRHSWKATILHACLRVGVVLYALSAHAQQIVVSQPDCIIFFSFTASGQTSPLSPNAGFSNLQNGCTTWNFSYANSGFSAITLAFQSAPNVAGVPGSWSTFAGGTILAGVNPNTNVTGAFSWLTGYNPWVRVALTSATGSGIVNGAIYGYRIPSAGATGTGTQTVTGTVTANQGTAGSAWPVSQSGTWTVQPGNTANTTAWKVDNSAVNQPVVGTAAVGSAPSGNPVYLAGLGSGITGGALIAPTICDQSAVITVSAAATTEIVPLTAARTVYVCSFSVSISLAGSAQFVDGTGTNCGTGAGNLTGAYAIATGNTSTQGAGLGMIFKTRSARALCLSAVTGNVTGVVTYAVY